MSLAAPEEMPGAFAEAWTARDAVALAALFAEDADFVNVVGIWWQDRPAIEAAHRRALTRFFDRSKLTVGRIKTRRLDRDHAVVHARLRLTGQTAPDGTEAGARTTILSFVMARGAAGWLCVSAQNTDVHPGRETHLNRRGHLAPQDYR